MRLPDGLGLEEHPLGQGAGASESSLDCQERGANHVPRSSITQPATKGWNTQRRHAGPGRDDTLLVDARGRAVVFGTGEPSGLASTLPGVLTQLRQVIGPHAPILLGFDRGGAYPSAFATCRDAGADWVTYRRAPGPPPPPPPREQPSPAPAYRCR